MKAVIGWLRGQVPGSRQFCLFFVENEFRPELRLFKNTQLQTGQKDEKNYCQPNGKHPSRISHALFDW